jgi:hypothetical protein
MVGVLSCLMVTGKLSVSLALCDASVCTLEEDFLLFCYENFFLVFILGPVGERS